MVQHALHLQWVPANAALAFMGQVKASAVSQRQDHRGTRPTAFAGSRDFRISAAPDAATLRQRKHVLKLIGNPNNAALTDTLNFVYGLLEACLAGARFGSRMPTICTVYALLTWDNMAVRPWVVLVMCVVVLAQVALLVGVLSASCPHVTPATMVTSTMLSHEDLTRT